MCPCTRLPDAFYFDDAPYGFGSGLELVETSNWVRLERCKECRTCWAVDEWDKYQDRVVSRVECGPGWEAASEQQRKLLLLQSRGGEGTGICIRADCDRTSVNGVVYCVDHLYDTGARR